MQPVVRVLAMAAALTVAVLEVENAGAAPSEPPLGKAQLVSCADASEVLTRGIHVVPSSQPNRPPALLSIRAFGSVASGEGSSRVWLEHAICPGARLVSGDRIRLSVWVARPLYVYVVSTRQDQSAELLYPSPGRPALVEANREVSLPQSGEVFELDDVSGKESFWVIASASRLSTDGASLAELLRTLPTERDPRTSAAPSAAGKGEPVPIPKASKATRRPSLVLASGERQPSKPVAAGPDVARISTRGIVVKRDDTIEALSADKLGVVAAPFWLQHAARP